HGRVLGGMSEADGMSDPPAETAPAPAPAAQPAPAAPPEERSLAQGLIGGGQSWWRAVLFPLLAFLSALVLGAILIVSTNEQTTRVWSGFCRDPIHALSVAWQGVRDSYSALFSGALGSPSTIAKAIGSGDIKQIRSSLFPLPETIVTATPLIFVGL